MARLVPSPVTLASTPAAPVRAQLHTARNFRNFAAARATRNHPDSVNPVSTSAAPPRAA